MFNPQGAGQAPNAPVSLPTGTVTFLLSEIEGSTQRWKSTRAAMDAAVKRHDTCFVFKTVGDAFCVAFARVSDAVTASTRAE